MKKKFRVLSIILMAFAFFSCRNLIGDDGSDELITDNIGVKSSYLIQGTVSQEDFIDSASRTAFPAQPSGTIKYIITAKCGDVTVSTDSDNSSAIYSLKLPSVGEWIITAEGYNSSTPSKCILKTSESKTITITEREPAGHANLVLKPYVSEEGKGNISLEITVPQNSVNRPVTTVYVNFDHTIQQSALSPSNNKVTIIESNIKTGSYTVEITFIGNSTIYYHVTEVINVYDNLTTNVWVKHGDEPYINASGEFVVTDDMTEDFLLSTVYVDGVNGNDSNTGSFLAPVKTFTQAVNISGAKNFFISGEVEAARELTVSKNGFIKKNPNATTAQINVSSAVTSSFITVNVEENKTFEISNVDIVGSETVIPDHGGAIYNQSGILILTNCNISKFGVAGINTKNGGAIYATKPVKMTGGSIKNCYALNGGGIYSLGADSNLELTSVTIESCTADESGGGIYNGGEIRMDGGSIVSCSAKKFGGGIYKKNRVFSGTLSNITINDCKATGDGSDNESSGGGICLNSGTLYIKGNSVIGKTTQTIPTSTSYGNYAKSYGGGIYVQAQGTLYLQENSLVGYNYAGDSGGGLAVVSESADAVINMESGTVQYNCAAGAKAGGIYVNEQYASASISGGLIQNNHSGYSAGGIYAGGDASLIMSGGEVKNNTATTKYNGIQIDGKIKISGNPSIKAGDDISLSGKNALINVTGEITNTGIVAQVGCYGAHNSRPDDSVIYSSVSSDLQKKSVCKFKLIEPEASEGYYINSSGCIGQIENFVSGAMILTNFSELDTTNSHPGIGVYGSSKPTTVYFVHDMEIDTNTRLYMSRATILIPKDETVTINVGDCSDKSVIETNSGSTIGSLDGGKLIIKGKDGNSAHNVIYNNSGTLKMYNVQIENMNANPVYLYREDVAHLTKCTIKNCNSTYASIFMSGCGELYLNECEILNNTTSNYSGGIYAIPESKIYFDLGEEYSVTKSTVISNNSNNHPSGKCGGIYLANGGLLVINSSKQVQITQNTCNYGNAKQLYSPQTIKYVLSESTTYDESKIKTIGNTNDDITVWP